jgi:hypothetical protein
MLQNEPLRLSPFQFDADPNSPFRCDVDPNPAFHFDADPDPASQNAGLRIRIHFIRIRTEF